MEIRHPSGCGFCDHGEPVEAPEPRPVRRRDFVRHRALLHGFNVQQAGGAGVVPFAAFVAGVDAYDLYRSVHDQRRALPSLEEPPADAACPQCAEPLQLVGYCGLCGWRGPEAAA